MNLPSHFTASELAAIEALRATIEAAKRRPVYTEVGSTDCGQHWVALCAEDRNQIAAPLLTIVTGVGVAGKAAVLDRHGFPVREGVSFKAAMGSAHKLGMRGTYRRRSRAGGGAV